MAPGAPFECGLGHACQFCPQEAVCGLDKGHHHRLLIEARLAEIDQIVVVLANKGGVGKSTVSTNLAVGLAQQSFRVGLADADIHGPNQSRFFGMAGARTRITSQGLQTLRFTAPELSHAVRVGSLAFLLADDTTPVVWRDPYKHDFIHHLIGSFDWGTLDFLIVDMPPGTGNELITLCDILEGARASALLVTTPQAIAQMDSLKAARFCRERDLPVIGAVENMAGVVCPHCDGAFSVFPNADLSGSLAAMDIARLGAIPLAPELALASDAGAPIVSAQPDSAVSRAFAPVIAAVAAVGRADAGAAVIRSVESAVAQHRTDATLRTALEALPETERTATTEAVDALFGQEISRLQAVAKTGRAP